MCESAVIMARIVDAAGKPLQPSSIESLSCSVVGYERQPLSVGEVFRDSLETNGTWTVDREGYNFRHEIDLGLASGVPKHGEHVEVRYELTPFAGPMTVLRFELGANLP